MLIEPRKSHEKIAGSDKGFDTDIFADLDKDENQTEGAVSMCQSFSIRPCLVFE